MGQVTTISFAVPSEHAMEFQRRGFALLEELAGGAVEASSAGPERGFVPADSAEVRGTDVWKMTPWTSGDGERAAWVAGQLPSHPRQVLTYLCKRPDQWVSGSDIAEQLGLRHGSKSVPPSFKSLANRCRRAYRAPMWSYDGQGGYRVSAMIAELFNPFLNDSDR